MHINHLDLQVDDVQATRVFFERYFGLTLQSNAASPAIAILTDENGFVLVLQKTKTPESVTPKTSISGSCSTTWRACVSSTRAPRGTGLR